MADFQRSGTGILGAAGAMAFLGLIEAIYLRLY
jgi:hypothetical protein